MTETILYLIATVLILGVLRSIIGIVLKGVSDFFGASSGSPGAAPSHSQASSIPKAEALKKDPVCGTYLAPSSAIPKTFGGTVYYFCSTECRDKFTAHDSPGRHA